MTSFLSGIAVVLSVLSLLLGGFATYQVINLQNEVGDLAATSPDASESSSSDQTSVASAPISTELNNPDASPAETATSTEIQPGQFVQPAFESKAEVELLSAKRIENPDTGTRDVVNVQFRIRRLAEDGVTGSNILSPGETTARNPETSETYEAVDFTNRATSPVGLYGVKPQASVDAYVWMQIPEGVDTVDLYLENTQAFKNVPIAE